MQTHSQSAERVRQVQTNFATEYPGINAPGEITKKDDEKTKKKWNKDKEKGAKFEVDRAKRDFKELADDLKKEAEKTIRDLKDAEFKAKKALNDAKDLVKSLDTTDASYATAVQDETDAQSHYEETQKAIKDAKEEIKQLKKDLKDAKKTMDKETKETLKQFKETAKEADNEQAFEASDISTTFIQLLDAKKVEGLTKVAQAKAKVDGVKSKFREEMKAEREKDRAQGGQDGQRNGGGRRLMSWNEDQATVLQEIMSNISDLFMQ